MDFRTLLTFRHDLTSDNIFFSFVLRTLREAGDMTHLFSIIVLLLKINATKSCSGVSLKTQELYLLVFVTRYLDLFQSYISLYNSCMKFIFIVSSGCIIGYMRKHKVVSQTYDAEQDTFRVAFLVWPSFLLAAVINQKLSVMEILWTFSIYLESVAILPQLVLLQRTKNVDNLTSNYVFLLGSYRGLYLLNWIYRCLTEEGYRQWIVWISGLLQTAIYCDFFYYYLKSWRKNERLSLPS
ncbi:uncharacterized protein MICPUCDRAFT_14346 [Micromonas pusilla CCMP1545]|uniref:ER lumen protein-retaining receptor n=1 Tax=Micromonas pusilla (strain CCMP1545) TaxID=564608 RepID=C1MKL1_MICPC|nr:uncharacterized protein MICPUCDRAFT_14346 [Micromonas pusilla CCMP1545]EEH59780.1 predicted protein [Micromonas pusilla CCMP1545]|eukprot:XP_003056404.1 predicted protein [Micromonas pusilla CCMP1545]